MTDVIGYQNELDFYCIECVEKRHVDVSTYKVLIYKKHASYACDFCCNVFPRSVDSKKRESEKTS